MSTVADGSPDELQRKFSTCTLLNCPPLVPGRLKKLGSFGISFIAIRRDVLKGRSRPAADPAHPARTRAGPERTRRLRRTGGPLRRGGSSLVDSSGEMPYGGCVRRD